MLPGCKGRFHQADLLDLVSTLLELFSGTPLDLIAEVLAEITQQLVKRRITP